MAIYWWLALVCGLTIIYLLPIRLMLQYKRYRGDDIFLIKLTVAGIFHYHKTYPIFRLKIKKHRLSFEMANRQNKPASQGNNDIDDYSMPEFFGIFRKKIRSYRHTYHTYYQAFRYLSARVKCEKFQWYTICGTPDPALTALAVGLIWQTKYIIFSLLAPNLHFAKNTPVINVQPDFLNSKFHTNFQSIFSLKLGNIIAMQCIILKIILLRKIKEVVDRRGVKR